VIAEKTGMERKDVEAIINTFVEIVKETSRKAMSYIKT